MLVRAIARYADPRAAQLQAAVDDLIQQVRLVPGQLGPLLRLLGVGEVVVDSDGDRESNLALDPVDVDARSRASSRSFARPTAVYAARPVLSRPRSAARARP